MTANTSTASQRINRSEFPDVDAIRAEAETEEAFVQKLGEKYQRVLDALGEVKALPNDIKVNLGSLIGDVKDDMREFFSDAGYRDFRASAIQVADVVSDLIRGSAEELIKVKEGGDDVLFLLKRLMHYRNALLEFIRLVDPLDIQEEYLGRAVLVYDEDGINGYTCRVDPNIPIADLLKDTKGSRAKAVTLPSKRDLYNLVDTMYAGADGILERCNVFLVEAPENVGLEPKQILGKAAVVYRKNCKERQAE